MRIAQEWDGASIFERPHAKRAECICSIIYGRLSSLKALLDARVGLHDQRVRLVEQKGGCYYTQRVRLWYYGNPLLQASRAHRNRGLSEPDSRSPTRASNRGFSDYISDARAVVKGGCCCSIAPEILKTCMQVHCCNSQVNTTSEVLDNHMALLRLSMDNLLYILLDNHMLYCEFQCSM